MYVVKLKKHYFPTYCQGKYWDNQYINEILNSKHGKLVYNLIKGKLKNNLMTFSSVIFTVHNHKLSVQCVLFKLILYFVEAKLDY